MRAARLVGSSLTAMGRYKLRSGFMMLGSAVGVAAITLVVSVSRGAERKVLSTVRQLFGDSSVLVMAGGGTLMGGPRAGAARLTVDDVDAVAHEVPGLDGWDAQQGLGVTSVRRGEKSAMSRVLGGTERAERVWSRGVSRGEFFDAAAVGASARVALIGETTARELFGSEDPLGAEILVGSVPLRVIGVLERFGTDLHGMDRDAELLVPLTTVMRRILNVDTIGAAKLLVRRREDVASTAAEVKRVLRARHGLSGGQPNDFSVVSTVQVQKMVDQARRVLFLFLPLAAAIALLTGGAVSAALMLASVSQRVAEIGLRRAVGARPRDVALQFLLESAVTMMAGGLGGLLAGTLASRLAAARLHLPGDVFSWSAVALGLALSCLVGLAAGVLPARRAARLSPVEALR